MRPEAGFIRPCTRMRYGSTAYGRHVFHALLYMVVLITGKGVLNRFFRNGALDELRQIRIVAAAAQRAPQIDIIV